MSEGEASLLADAHAACKNIADRLSNVDSRYAGLIQCRAEVTGPAIFDLLNYAASYGESAPATDAVGVILTRGRPVTTDVE